MKKTENAYKLTYRLYGEKGEKMKKETALKRHICLHEKLLQRKKMPTRKKSWKSWNDRRYLARFDSLRSFQKRKK